MEWRRVLGRAVSQSRALLYGQRALRACCVLLRKAAARLATVTAWSLEVLDWPTRISLAKTGASGREKRDLRSPAFPPTCFCAASVLLFSLSQKLQQGRNIEISHCRSHGTRDMRHTDLPWLRRYFKVLGRKEADG